MILNDNYLATRDAMPSWQARQRPNGREPKVFRQSDKLTYQPSFVLSRDAKFRSFAIKFSSLLLSKIRTYRFHRQRRQHGRGLLRAHGQFGFDVMRAVIMLM